MPISKVKETKIIMQTHQRRTKFVATVGPAIRTPAKMREMIKAGTNVFRLNFSHSTHVEHLETLNMIRAASKEVGLPVAVLQDLAGPKIRISKVHGDYLSIIDGAHIEICKADGSECSASRVYVEHLDPATFLKPGQQVLLADGLIELITEEVQSKIAKCKITKGGMLRSRVGIAFPDSTFELPATTEKDMADLAWGVKNDVDYVAVSFVKNAADISKIRKFAHDNGGDPMIIAKIERKAALENIDEIMAASDGVMVARGDLGLELPLERVPTLQKQLIEQCNFRGIPVIVATQMMSSMVTSVRPTRAEVSDIATAVMSGADAVMLSEESSIGEHPVECVKWLEKVAHEAEKGFVFQAYRLRLHDSDSASVPDAVAYAAAAAAVKMNASAIIACTETGTSARLLAKYRPQQPLYGASSKESTIRRMCLNWGVHPISTASPSTHQDELEIALRAVQMRENLPNGSLAVITGGIAVRTPGSTSVLEIKEMSFK
jgi:pyruvate kinase